MSKIFDDFRSFSAAGVDYFLTANQGAARKYSSFDEVIKVGNITLDTSDFTDIGNLQSASSLGRLQVSFSIGDTERDGKIDELYAFGGRSFGQEWYYRSIGV